MGTKNRSFLSLLAILLLSLGVSCGETAVAPPPTPTYTPQEIIGQKAFITDCGSCHSLTEETLIVGPSLAGIGRQAAERVPGQDAKTYLLTSILRPNDHIIDGFDALMPENFGKKLTGEEIDGLVAFLLTQ